jgi:hypothetical protein
LVDISAACVVAEQATAFDSEKYNYWRSTFLTFISGLPLIATGAGVFFFGFTSLETKMEATIENLESNVEVKIGKLESIVESVKTEVNSFKVELGRINRRLDILVGILVLVPPLVLWSLAGT